MKADLFERFKKRTAVEVNEDAGSVTSSTTKKKETAGESKTHDEIRADLQALIRNSLQSTEGICDSQGEGARASSLGRSTG